MLISSVGETTRRPSVTRRTAGTSDDMDQGQTPPKQRQDQLGTGEHPQGAIRERARGERRLVVVPRTTCGRHRVLRLDDRQDLL